MTKLILIWTAMKKIWILFILQKENGYCLLFFKLYKIVKYKTYFVTKLYLINIDSYEENMDIVYYLKIK